METTKILLCEDDESLGMLLREYLQVKGYNATLCSDGEEGLEAFQANSFDICVLDVMMPRKDGFTLAKEIKQLNPDMPVVFLTAKVLKEDVVEGFQIGADDYITKPFSMEELTLRIEAIMRRVIARRIMECAQIRIGDFVYDPKKQFLLCPNGETRKVTTKESELLMLLYRNANQVLQRDVALKTIWADDNYFNARSMDVYITKLRKLLQGNSTAQIINVHGRGYRLVLSEPNEDSDQSL